MHPCNDGSSALRPKICGLNEHCSDLCNISSIKWQTWFYSNVITHIKNIHSVQMSTFFCPQGPRLDWMWTTPHIGFLWSRSIGPFWSVHPHARAERVISGMQQNAILIHGRVAGTCFHTDAVVMLKGHHTKDHFLHFFKNIKCHWVICFLRTSLSLKEYIWMRTSFQLK